MKKFSGLKWRFRQALTVVSENVLAIRSGSNAQSLGLTWCVGCTRILWDGGAGEQADNRDHYHPFDQRKA